MLTLYNIFSLSGYCDQYGKLPERKIWRVLYDIAKVGLGFRWLLTCGLGMFQALKHLHDNRLCHMDVKPANIFLSQDGYNCKLGDFGLVVSIDSSK